MSLTKCKPTRIVVGSCDDIVTLDGDGRIRGAEITELRGDTLLVNCEGQSGSGSSRMITGQTFNFVGGRMTMSGNSVSIVNGRVHLGAARVWQKGKDLHVKLPADMQLVLNGQRTGGDGVAVGEPPASRVRHHIDVTSSVREFKLQGDAKVVLRSTEANAWLSTDALRFNASGSATLRIAAPLRVRRLIVRASGASRVVGNELLRADQSVDLEASGASNINGVLAPRGGRAEASGASNIELAAYARESVQRDVSGASNVTVRVMRDAETNERKRKRRRAAAANDNDDE